MKTPRFFLAAVLLFWGWQVQTVWIALILAIILEAGRNLKIRFALTPSDFNKFVDISVVFLLGTLVFGLVNEAPKAGLLLLKWLPLILFPVVASQEFSDKGRIDIQSFFFTIRKKARLQFYEPEEIDVSYIFSLVCVFSAAGANAKGNLFYLVTGMFLVWALWCLRSLRTKVMVWGLCMAVVLASGYMGHKEIRQIGRRMNFWLMSYYFNYLIANPFKTHTSLGEIGKLKVSDTIVFRAWFENYEPGRRYLLHSATYTRFSASNWFADPGFVPVLGNEEKNFWQIHPRVANLSKMRLYLRLVKEKAVLSLPPGVIEIDEMKVGECEKNKYQVIRIQEGPALIKAVVSYTGQYAHDAPPEETDLSIPKKELPALERISEALGLEHQTPEAVLKTLQKFFLTAYTYSLDLKGRGEGATPLQNFLTTARAGHCEFFATATVLLLRKANIPARYATGFMAHEFSRLENQLVVRYRDSHAWAKVFINGQWQNFDTTPPDFLQLDRQQIQASVVSDFFSFLSFKLSQFRHETGGKLMNQYGLWLILPLAGIVFFRLKSTGRIQRVKDVREAQHRNVQNTNDSRFHLIEAVLTQKGWPRMPWETYLAWIVRIGPTLGEQDIHTHLHGLLKDHNRCRFSRQGLTLKENQNFNDRVDEILKKIKK